MSEKFKKLDEEKKERILKAALIEFAEEGYDKASTNKIVKHAGIGKGMLFYYFTSKLDLYHYLVNYSVDKLVVHYLDAIDGESDNLVDWLAYIAKLKFSYFQEYPEVNRFMGTLLLVDEDKLPVELQQKLDKVKGMAEKKLYGHKETSHEPFREGIDPDKARQLIEWSIQGYQKDLLAKSKGKKLAELDLTGMWAEFDDYLIILKSCFYK